MNLKLFLMLIGVISLLFAGGPYLIVFDSSGSMSDYVKDLNATKIEVAKKAANHFIDRSSGEIGLIEFSDCDKEGDIYSGGITLVQDFTTNKEELKNKINALKPKSDTPIADALSEASKYLKKSRGHGTIILITDGEETCGGDPVNIAESIYNEKIGTVHVIGYRISGKAESKAKAIAEAGGGKYYPVENADELESALTEITTGGFSCCPSTILLLALPLFIMIAGRHLN